MKILKEANIDFEELTPTYEIKDGIEVPVGFTIKINSSDDSETVSVFSTKYGMYIISDIKKTFFSLSQFRKISICPIVSCGSLPEIEDK